MTVSCRDNGVYIYINSLHSQDLKDVDAKIQSVLSDQFSLSKIRKLRESKISGFGVFLMFQWTVLIVFIELM